MLNEFDRHNLMLIKNRIINFKANEANLEDLLSITNSIEKKLNASTNIDPKLKETINSEWWELELLSSVMIDSKEKMIDEESRKELAFALSNIKEIIDKALNEK